MTIKEYFSKYNGKFIDWDKHYGPTCVDNYRQYCQEVLQVPQSPPVQGAAGIWDNYRQDLFVKIPNTPLGVPQFGDIVIWNKRLNGYGHVAIFQTGGIWSFTSFDQNWPVGVPCHFQKHNYRYVLGWLRSKVVVKEPILPKVPLPVAFVGLKLPLHEEFQTQVALYSQNKISVVINDYNVDLGSPRTMTQDEAYAIVDRIRPKEKFIFIFYTPIPGASYYYFTSYSYPKYDCCITSCPATDPRALAFEFSHQLTKFFNDHRGLLPPVEDTDMPGATGPSDDFIMRKYDLISGYYSVSKFYQ